MTALDQAFVKAYMLQEEAEASSPPDAAGSAGADGKGIETAATLEQIGSAGAAYRVDPVNAAELPPPVDGQVVPPPHAEMTGAGQPAGAQAANTVPSPEESATQPFRPMLQVDRFIWPKVCHRLAKAAQDEIDRLADALVAATTRGQRVLGMRGCRPGAGTTTMLLCAARCLKHRHLKVAMVDAHSTDPRLSAELGLLPKSGWEEVLAGRLPLEEVVIESADSQVAVLPALGPMPAADNPLEQEARIVESIRTLGLRYDLVLVDMGAWDETAEAGSAPAGPIGRLVDAVVLIQDVRTTNRQCLAQLHQGLVAAGIVPAGIVQNLVSV